MCFGEQEHITGWVESYLKEIEIAFRWREPSVIFSHSVNCVGSIRPENRDQGLRELKRLLAQVIEKMARCGVYEFVGVRLLS